MARSTARVSASSGYCQTVGIQELPKADRWIIGPYPFSAVERGECRDSVDRELGDHLWPLPPVDFSGAPPAVLRSAALRAGPAGMRPAGLSPPAAATRIKSPARTTPRGSPGPNSWPGWSRSFRGSTRVVVTTSDSLRSSPSRGRSGRSSAPLSEDRIQPDRSRLLLLMIRLTRPTLAEVPLADLSFLNPSDLCRLSAAWFGFRPVCH